MNEEKKAPEPKFTGSIKCNHCGNEVYMKEACYYDRIQSEETDDGKWFWQEGPVWRLLECPACFSITLLYYHFDDRFEPEQWETQILYPSIHQELEGLPSRVQKAYGAALKVRNIDSNAFAVLLGRVIDEVCIDRGISGESLFDRLNSLAEKGEIPIRLKNMGHQLRHLRNMGAHADLGDLTPAEVPILDSLCKAILEYVYAAPRLIDQVESRIEKLKKNKEGIEDKA